MISQKTNRKADILLRKALAMEKYLDLNKMAVLEMARRSGISRGDGW